MPAADFARPTKKYNGGMRIYWMLPAINLSAYIDGASSSRTARCFRGRARKWSDKQFAYQLVYCRRLDSSWRLWPLIACRFLHSSVTHTWVPCNVDFSFRRFTKLLSCLDSARRSEQGFLLIPFLPRPSDDCKWVRCESGKLLPLITTGKLYLFSGFVDLDYLGI